MPVKTDSYEIDDNLIWGATARILTVLLERLDPLIEMPSDEQQPERSEVAEPEEAEDPDDEPEEPEAEAAAD